MENKDLGFWHKFPYKYAQLENENRKTILFPAIKNLINTKEMARILDYGGGDGGFLEDINCSCEKVLYDPSEGMIRFAMENRKTISTYVGDDSKLVLKGFDLVTLIHVITVIKKDKELKRILKKIKGLMADGGEFIIGMTHPSFKNNFFSTFHTDFSTGKMEFDYLSNKLSYYVHLNTDIPGSFISFECYHRPLSTVFNMLIEAGFTIRTVLEVKDIDFDKPEKKFLFPPFLIIKCI